MGRRSVSLRVEQFCDIEFVSERSGLVANCDRSPGFLTRYDNKNGDSLKCTACTSRSSRVELWGAKSMGSAIPGCSYCKIVSGKIIASHLLLAIVKRGSNDQDPSMTRTVEHACTSSLNLDDSASHPS